MPDRTQYPMIDRLARGERVRPDRDRVLTIAFGRLRCGGALVDTDEWEALAVNAAEDVRACGGTVYAVTTGSGVASDGVNAGVPEETLVILAGNVRDVVTLRKIVAWRLRALRLSSACFALDGTHEPAFPTLDGWRHEGEEA